MIRKQPRGKAPQEPVGAGVQVTAQSTPPPLVRSFVTVALTFAVPFTGREVGAPVIEEMDITGVFTVITAVTKATGLAVELAVIETARPLVGTVAGAVYAMAVPLAVCAGVFGFNVPHPFAPFEQERDQSTPRFWLSLETIARWT